VSQIPLPFPIPPPDPEAESFIFAGGASHCIVQTGDICVQSYVRYTVGGQEVANVDIKFSLEDVPPELHTHILNDLMCRRMSLEIGSIAHMYWPDKYGRGHLSLASSRQVADGALSLATAAAEGALSLVQEARVARAEAVPWWGRLWRFLRRVR